MVAAKANGLGNFFNNDGDLTACLIKLNNGPNKVFNNCQPNLTILLTINVPKNPNQITGKYDQASTNLSFASLNKSDVTNSLNQSIIFAVNSNVSP